MKKQYLLIALLTCLMNIAFGQISTILQHEITVDGNLDDWQEIEATSSDANNAPDFALSYKLSWDSEHLYVLFEVEDDTAAVLGKGIYADQKAWHVDLVYLHIDVDNSKGDDLDGKNDFALRIHRDTLLETGASGWPIWYGKIPGLDNSPGYTSDVWGTSYQNGFSGMGLTMVQNETEKGYNIEMAIPFEFLTKADENLSPTDLSNSSELGLRVELHDMDALDDQSGLSIPNGSEWGNPSTWGTVVLKGDDTPVHDIVIDGEIDNLWNETPMFEYSTIVHPIDASHKPHEVENETDFSGYIKIRWTEAGLYFLADVKDEAYVKADKVASSDYVEIGIDPENVKNFADPGFISFTICPEDASYGGRVAPGWGNAPQIDYAVKKNTDGYTVECLFPVDSMRNPSMQAGTLIGFDSKINDVDDAANPKWDHLGWNMEYGYIWRDPFRYGTIELLADGTVNGYKSPGEPQNFQASVTGSDVEFTWDKVDEADGYYLIKEINDEEGVVIEETISDGNTTSTVKSGLTPGIYEFILVAYSTGDTRSAPNQSVTFEVKALSSDNDILDFKFSGITADSVTIQDDRIVVYLPAGSDLTGLVPDITIDENATITPEPGIETDYTGSVGYEVTAEDGTSKDWTVEVIVGKTSVYISISQALRCFPNPVTDILQINGINHGSLTMFDLSGKKVFYSSNMKHSIDMSSIKSGLYILEIKSEKNVYRRKICVK